jgi:transcriptional regulator with XRE-family HTH domain
MPSVMLGGRHHCAGVIAMRSAGVDTSVELDRYIDRILESLGLSRAELAQALEVSERSIKRWQAGKSFPQYESRARLEELDALADRALASFPDVPSIHAWLRAPNASSDGRSLVDAIAMDRFDLVNVALDRRNAGSTGS